MAYVSGNLSNVEFIGGGGGNHLWFLLTEDAEAALEAADYIADGAAKGMTAGDIVLVSRVTTLPATTPIGVAVHQVTAVGAVAATISNAAAA